MPIKYLALICFSLILSGCGGGGGGDDGGDSTEYPIVTDDLISGKIIFRDENSNEIAIPEDTWIRVLPSTYYNNANFTGLNCKITIDGQIGKECYIHRNETEIRNLFAESSETFEIVVYQEQTGDLHWNASENANYSQQNNVPTGSWETIFITPTGMFFTDPSGSSSDSENTTVLEGKWVKGCSPFSYPNTPGAHNIVTLTYSGINEVISDGISSYNEQTAKVTREIKTYQDSSCIVPVATYTPEDQHPDNWRYPITTHNGYFEFYEDIVTTGGLQATQIYSQYTIFTDAELSIFYINADTLYFGTRGQTRFVFPDTLDLTQEYIKQP